MIFKKNLMAGKFKYHLLTDWMAIEAIVRQKDKETTAANIAKLAGKFIYIFKWRENLNLI